MKYRSFGKLDYRPSALGFGAMRLPVIDDDSSQINEKEAIKMIRYAIDHGVNYIDTAWPYHGKNSEPLVGKALKDGYREKVKLATKLPSWKIEKKQDLDTYFNKQLEKLATEYIDFYLLHALNKNFWQNLLKVDVFSWIDNMLTKGKIKHIGFSFHDSFDLFKEIVDYYDNWDFCQIQYNYLDIDYQAGKRGLKYAAEKGLAVIIMEPLRGGQLAVDQPEAVKEIMENAPVKRKPADWALQWLWNQKEVSLVLSGMSNLEQVKENIESADRSGINTLGPEDMEVINKVRKKYEELLVINCTGCSYCMPCPNDIEITENFKLYNEANLYNQFKDKKEMYKKWPDKIRASSCVTCRVCEDHCPQNLEISSLLEDVAQYFKED